MNWVQLFYVWLDALKKMLTVQKRGWKTKAFISSEMREREREYGGNGSLNDCQYLLNAANFLLLTRFFYKTVVD